MKYQEYLQITKSNKNYLQDFISVLENDDDGPETTTSNFQYQMKSVNYQNNRKDSYSGFYEQAHHYHRNQEQIELSTNNQVCVRNYNTSELQKKAREAIKNSRLAIKKIKTNTSGFN